MREHEGNPTSLARSSERGVLIFSSYTNQSKRKTNIGEWGPFLPAHLPLEGLLAAGASSLPLALQESGPSFSRFLVLVFAGQEELVPVDYRDVGA